MEGHRQGLKRKTLVRNPTGFASQLKGSILSSFGILMKEKILHESFNGMLVCFHIHNMFPTPTSSSPANRP
jgi:hypothetical protein